MRGGARRVAERAEHRAETESESTRDVVDRTDAG
jgi:hypothetical protein